MATTSSRQRSIDLGLYGGLAVGAAVVFATTWSPQVGLGDAPESVAGVEAVGILHAPGYPLYVLAARLLSEALPVGSLAARVNAFSFLCAVATVLLVAAAARAVGASRPAAAIAGAVTATSVSIWFYAGFAKHDAFTTMLAAAAIAVIVTGVTTSRRAAGLGVLLGALLGAGWFAVLVIAPSALYTATRGDPARRRRHVVILIATTASVGLVVVAYVLVRAGQRPELNWGEASTLNRFVELVTLSDFGFGAGTATGSSSKAIGTGSLVAIPGHLLAYLAVLVRDLGPVAVVLAAIGGAAPHLRNTTAGRALLGVVGVNLLVVAAVLGVRVRGFESSIVHGGFIAPTLLAIAIFTAAGVDRLLQLTAAGSTRRRTRRTRGPAPSWVLGAIAVLAVGTSAISHHAAADHPAEPLADRWAADVFDELPVDAVVFVWGAERTFPLTYRQVVHGDRPDVFVIATDGLGTEWYLDQIGRQLDLEHPASSDVLANAATLIDTLEAEGRAVHLDAPTGDLLAGRVGHTPVGLTSQVTDGSGLVPPDAASMAALVERIEDLVVGVPNLAADDMGRWPNDFVLDTYGLAATTATRAALAARDEPNAVRALTVAVRLRPDDPEVRRAAELLGVHR